MPALEGNLQTRDEELSSTKLLAGLLVSGTLSCDGQSAVLNTTIWKSNVDMPITQIKKRITYMTEEEEHQKWAELLLLRKWS